MDEVSMATKPETLVDAIEGAEDAMDVSEVDEGVETKLTGRSPVAEPEESFVAGVDECMCIVVVVVVVVDASVT